MTIWHVIFPMLDREVGALHIPSQRQSSASVCDIMLNGNHNRDGEVNILHSYWSDRVTDSLWLVGSPGHWLNTKYISFDPRGAQLSQQSPSNVCQGRGWLLSRKYTPGRYPAPAPRVANSRHRGPRHRTPGHRDIGCGARVQWPQFSHPQLWAAGSCPGCRHTAPRNSPEQTFISQPRPQGAGSRGSGAAGL